MPINRKKITQKLALSNNEKKSKATTKPWFSRLLRHPAGKRSGSILGHNTHTPDPHGGATERSRFSISGDVEPLAFSECENAECVCAGELGKLELLQEGILHKCVKQLIERKKSALGGAARISDMSEDIECLCEIMRTVGQRLDHDRARTWMDQYFERIRAYQSNPELPARIRFLLQDIIELRARRWQPRKLLLAEGAPKTIQQVWNIAY